MLGFKKPTLRFFTGDDIPNDICTGSPSKLKVERCGAALYHLQHFAPSQIQVPEPLHPEWYF
jgi:hypothetical protein